MLNVKVNDGKPVVVLPIKPWSKRLRGLAIGRGNWQPPGPCVTVVSKGEVKLPGRYRRMVAEDQRNSVQRAELSTKPNASD